MDINTKEILVLEVTDEKVYDSKVIKKLVENVSSNNVKVKSCLGDGAYDSNENFEYQNEKRIKAIIKIKKNSTSSSKK